MKIRVLMTAMMLMLSVPSYSADDQPKAASAPSAKLTSKIPSNIWIILTSNTTLIRFWYAALIITQILFLK